MPVIFEFIFIGGGESEWEKTAVRLISAYKKAYSEAKGVEKISYPLTRVIPVTRTIKAGNTIQVLKQPRPGLVFNSGFKPAFDVEHCVACETCIERCPPEALTMGEANVPVVNTDRCFGWGVCATGCLEGAIEMENKPGFPTPPKTVKELVTALKNSAQGQN